MMISSVKVKLPITTRSPSGISSKYISVPRRKNRPGGEAQHLVRPDKVLALEIDEAAPALGRRPQANHFGAALERIVRPHRLVPARVVHAHAANARRFVEQPIAQ